MGERCAGGSRRTSAVDGSVDDCLSRFGGPAISISPKGATATSRENGTRRWMERWMEEEEVANSLHGVTPSQPYLGKISLRLQQVERNW